VIGPKLYDIPVEELFFFVIQTYNTSLLYLLFSKPVFHPIYLRHEEKTDKWKYYKIMVQLALAMVLKRALNWVNENKQGTYLGLILLWAVPFIILLWSLAYQLIIQLPLSSTLLPIALPTAYLWIVDTLALNRGTWVIEDGTKLGIHLWSGLDIEEAIFFLLTNTLIVFGLIAFDNAIAILDAFPFHFPSPSALPSPVTLVRALLLPASAYDSDRINGFKQAVTRLQQKSRSFYLASGVFDRRLRIDLILLYSFCRVADDLVDNAETSQGAQQWIKRIRHFLDLSYKSKDPMAKDPNVGAIALYVVQNFPQATQLALLQLPTDRLSSQPLYDLLKGFETDLDFQSSKPKQQDSVKFPMRSQEDLDLYGERVAGTVAELCIDLVFSYYTKTTSEAEKNAVKLAGRHMGIALQYTNIARDVSVDARINRLYLPSSWLKQENLSPEDALALIKALDANQDTEGPFAERIERLRARLLDRAFALYEDARPAIEKLPREARASMRVAVESYMEIGRTLRQKGYVVKHGRATVPIRRRLVVAYKALSQ